MPKKMPNPPEPKAPKKPSPWLVLLAIVLVFTVVSSLFSTPQDDTSAQEIALSEFQSNFKSGKYETVKIRGEEIVGVIGENNEEKAFIRVSDTIADLGLNNPPEGTKVEVVSLERQTFWLNLLGDILPFIIIVGIIVFLMTRMTKNAGGPFSFGQSKAKLFDRRKKKTKFTDVAGAHEAKEELMEIVDFLKNPKKYVKMGAKIPRGALLVGPPGTGKTLLARAVAGEANVPFMSISGSEFVEMFVGVGASRVRDLFEKAKKNAPAIIFIDEIDAVGRQRGGTGFGGGHDEREQTLNQILTEMDGFDNDTSVIVMAATNRPDVLDKALLRPGRFDRRIIIDKPDVQAREEILKVHGLNKPIAKNANLTDIAKITIGFSGADLENVMNEAAILVARENRQKITHEDLSKSVEKVSLGPERKSKIIEPEEKEKVAYHETGHALVAHLLKGADPVHKVTIVSRGVTGGVTWFLPENEGTLSTKSQFLDRICAALGGYAAEKFIYGEVSIGASSDLRKATSMARSMATRYGMSSLGPISFADSEDYAGYESFGVKGISEEYARKIDEFVQQTVEESLVKTMEVLKKNSGLLEAIARELLKKETLNKQEFAAFFKGVDVPSKKTPKKNIQSGDLKSFEENSGS